MIIYQIVHEKAPQCLGRNTFFYLGKGVVVSGKINSQSIIVEFIQAFEIYRGISKCVSGAVGRGLCNRHNRKPQTKTFYCGAMYRLLDVVNGLAWITEQ